MKEKFDSKFHQQYVGATDGEIVEKDAVGFERSVFVPQTIQDILKVYRAYVNDPKAELPEAILEELRAQGKII